MTAARKVALRRNLRASIVGNVLEWYDFAVYGYFAPVLGQVFFPADDPTASLLAAFAVGYAARILGGVVFGHIADTVGRKKALLNSIVMMGVSTLLIALLPGYEALGLAAAVLLVLLRVVQGIAVGGEFSGSIVFLAEHAPDERRGLVVS